ncbi:hypothetical protein CPB83DRAFT_839617 [Crepidotus variabilis]|uniref:Uncharacterized protein n=1 Tax=Crepidotus variabilis TaxID=179855 RepID=A0A9P6E6Y9_9AGAR|nr:hypothetical protein CPB83DRAFT_839617 [Crepidotus variabilis]
MPLTYSALLLLLPTLPLLNHATSFLADCYLDNIIAKLWVLWKNAGGPVVEKRVNMSTEKPATEATTSSNTLQQLAPSSIGDDVSIARNKVELVIAESFWKSCRIKSRGEVVIEVASRTPQGWSTIEVVQKRYKKKLWGSVKIIEKARDVVVRPGEKY